MYSENVNSRYQFSLWRTFPKCDLCCAKIERTFGENEEFKILPLKLCELGQSSLYHSNVEGIINHVYLF